jgi:Bacterial SH3 domain
VFSFYWGALGWRISPSDQVALPQFTLTPTFGPTLTPSPTPAPTLVTVCPAQPRLTVGGQGIVLEGRPNNIRTEPSVNAEIIGIIPAGGVFDVLGNQICRDGIIWWQVSYNSLSGWTAENQNGDYFVAPTP